jgi:hypothetical protein
MSTKDLAASDCNRNYFLKNIWLIILLSGTLVMTAVMAIQGAPLTTPGTPKGILDLEFAYNSSLANSVLHSWAANSSIDNIFRAKTNTWLDFIYLLFYSLFFYHACKLLAKSFDGFLGMAGQLLSKGAIVAGGLDVLENTGMLLTLNGQLSEYTTLLTFVFSLLKWALVTAAILYIALTKSLLIGRKKGNSIRVNFC